MHEPDFWSNSAEALELSIEGNRLIVRELADLVLEMWQRIVPLVEHFARGDAAHRHLPPT